MEVGNLYFTRNASKVHSYMSIHTQYVYPILYFEYMDIYTLCESYMLPVPSSGVLLTTLLSGRRYIGRGRVYTTEQRLRGMLSTLEITSCTLNRIQSLSINVGVIMTPSVDHGLKCE